MSPTTLWQSPYRHCSDGSFFLSPTVLGSLWEMPYWQGGLLESRAKVLESRPTFPSLSCDVGQVSHLYPGFTLL